MQREIVNNDQIDFIEIFATLWGRRWTIIFCTLLCGVVSVIYTLNLPDIFRAKAVFIIPNSSQNRVSGFISQLSSLPFIGNVASANNFDSLEIYKAHLLKRENLWKVINKFNLKEHYNIRSPHKVDVENAYLSGLTIQKNKKTGLVDVTFDSREPMLARDVVNFNLRLLSNITNLTLISENKKKQAFLSQRLSKVREKLRFTEEALKLYQQEHQIISLSAQSKATIDAVSKIQSEILVNQVKLKTKLKLGINENHPDVKLLTSEIEVFKKQIMDIEAGRIVSEKYLSNNEISKGLTYISLAELPEKKLELERLSRQKIVQQEIYQVLAKENELAAIESAKETDLIEIIEWANVPEKKFKPGRTKICFFVSVISFFISCVLVLLGRALIDPAE